LSGYDATFVALAESVSGRWLTADREAVRIAGSRLAELLESR
jgi:predicted nucleic acid-binding protein